MLCQKLNLELIFREIFKYSPSVNYSEDEKLYRTTLFYGFMYQISWNIVLYHYFFLLLLGI